MCAFLLPSHDTFDVSPPSLDDNRMLTISQKISRPQLVANPVDSTNGGEPLGSSTPPPTADNVHCHLRATALRTNPSDSLAPSSATLGYTNLQQLEEGLDLLSDDKLDNLH